MFHISSFYKFHAVSEAAVPEIKAQLHRFADAEGLRGLIILATEGINGTVSAPQPVLDEFKHLLGRHFGEENWPYKDSRAEKNPFKRFKVKVRREIVTTGESQPPAVPTQKNALSPSEWHQLLTTEDEDLILLDTRNYYETELGMFKGAIDPQLVHFRNFTDFVQESAFPKEKKILMYCTGGIRCEKAVYQMEQLGYHNTFQLEGGILNYLAQYPEQLFEGECFVFDQRTALTQELQPSSRWSLCPHCGQPGDLLIECLVCTSEAKLCRRCFEDRNISSCSKDCEHRRGKRKDCNASSTSAEM